MGRRTAALAAILIASLALHGLFIGFFGAKGATPAFGQSGGAAQGDFVVTTEKGADQSPVCFVLRNRDPPLLVYRVSPMGQLQLMDSRDLTCDLALKDGYFAPIQGQRGNTTQPPVQEICTQSKGGATSGESGGEKKAGEK